MECFSIANLFQIAINYLFYNPFCFSLSTGVPIFTKRLMQNLCVVQCSRNTPSGIWYLYWISCKTIGVFQISTMSYQRAGDAFRFSLKRTLVYLSSMSAVYRRHFVCKPEMEAVVHSLQCWNSEAAIAWCTSFNTSVVILKEFTVLHKSQYKVQSNCTPKRYKSRFVSAATFLSNYDIRSTSGVIIRNVLHKS